MTPTRWILLVLEDGLFPGERISYTVKLAKRMRCAISILMLPGNHLSETGMGGGEEEMMMHTLNMINGDGVYAKGVIMRGDKASAFLKHLALAGSLTIIVWGGQEDIEKGIAKKSKDAWFTKVKSAVQCPVVRPAAKSRTKSGTV